MRLQEMCFDDLMKGTETLLLMGQPTLHFNLEIF